MSDLGSVLSGLLEILRLEPVVVVEQALFIGVGSLVFLTFAVSYKSMADYSLFSPLSAFGIALAVIVGVLSQFGLETLTKIFTFIYVPTSVLLRAAQGFSVGFVLRPRYLLLFFLIALLTAIFWGELTQLRVPGNLPRGSVPRAGMALLVCVTSSIALTRSMRDTSPFDSPLLMLALFLVFLSVQLYLPHRPGWVFAYRWAFPTVLVMALIGRAWLHLHDR